MSFYRARGRFTINTGWLGAYKAVAVSLQPLQPLWSLHQGGIQHHPESRGDNDDGLHKIRLWTRRGYCHFPVAQRSVAILIFFKRAVAIWRRRQPQTVQVWAAGS